ncbi:hypothetical protein B0T14DRAFT_48094 [Immersiella caudata]|uniref:Uncharacterized protein n=1 Tax=Immersiella caudata TaxID=314043 RepID=A0AA39XFV8_9PEZI|nr:hypothetical protein B0T14DRAFT_48094 [Immersiella caudata]
MNTGRVRRVRLAVSDRYSCVEPADHSSCSASTLLESFEHLLRVSGAERMWSKSLDDCRRAFFVVFGEANKWRKSLGIKNELTSFERLVSLRIACAVLEALAAGVRILARAVLPPPGCPRPDWASWFQVNAELRSPFVGCVLTALFVTCNPNASSFVLGRNRVESRSTQKVRLGRTVRRERRRCRPGKSQDIPPAMDPSLDRAIKTSKARRMPRRPVSALLLLGLTPANVELARWRASQPRAKGGSHRG